MHLFRNVFAVAALAMAPWISAGALAATPLQPAAKPVAAAPMSEGEIKKVDKENGKLTIKHGPLENLGMPGMTMVFRVRDPAMLERLKPGDKVRFVVEKVGGQLTVTQVEPWPGML